MRYKKKYGKKSYGRKGSMKLHRGKRIKSYGSSRGGIRL